MTTDQTAAADEGHEIWLKDLQNFQWMSLVQRFFSSISKVINETYLLILY